MSIQGMSQGLSFSNMSYYISEEVPNIAICTTPPLNAENTQGIYNTTFDMGTASGAAIITFEIGDGYRDQPTTAPIVGGLGDRLSWEYAGTYNSEYSCCQMGEPQPGVNYVNDPTATTRYRLMGRGYARGFLSSGYNHNGTGSKTYNTNYSLYGNGSVPLSPVTGSKLIASPGTWTQPYLLDPAGGFRTQSYNIPSESDSTDGSGMGNGGIYPATRNGYISSASPTTPQHGVGLQQIEHGSFVSYEGTSPYTMTASTGLPTYDYMNPSGTYVKRNLGSGALTDDVLDYCGPYTGHDEVEGLDKFNSKAYPGSSGVTLDNGRFATRQAMMVVPIAGGGLVRCRLEAPFKGTWAAVKIFCPITLPKWGGANNKAGIASVYSDADLHTALQITGTTGVLASQTSSGSTAVELTASNADIKVNQLVTGTNVAAGTIVQAVSGVNVTLSIAASGDVTSGSTLTFHKSEIRRLFDNENNRLTNNNLNPQYAMDPTDTTDTSDFFTKFASVVKWKPYSTSTQALAHDFADPANTPHFPNAANKTFYHVPSQNSIYREQGYAGFKAGGSIGENSAGGGPESNHGEHVLGAHGSRPLAWNTLNSTDELAHHGVVNEGDWVFTKSNGARASRLRARGILDMTVYADNDYDTVGGWYAMKIGSNQYAVQVGSLDYSRGEVTVDVVSGTVPRNGVVRTVTT